MAKKIVIAEDEPHIAKLVVFKLEREGYDVTWAKDGGEAWDMIQKTAPDLAILDVMMPVMDGFEVLKKIKEDESLKDLPILILSARGQEQDVVRGFDLGVDDYIVKPFKPAELVARIKRALK